jgi:hypothetical protein
MKARIIYAASLILLIVSCKSKIDFIPVQNTPYVPTSDLLISEISTAINTDANAGGKRNHYVELYNGTTDSVDLSDYAIGYQAVSDSSTLSPWDFTDPNNCLTLTGSVHSGSCYVIASAAADTSITNKSNFVWGTTSTSSANASKPLQLSGNSAIALLKKDATGTYIISGTKYRIIDVFGSPLVSRVDASLNGGATSVRNNFNWTIGGEFDTRNRTFKRKGNVTTPNTDWNLSKGTDASNSEWLISADKAWNYSNLSLPTIPPPTIPTLTTDSITQITDTTALGGGNIIDDGGSSVTVRGICWSASPNPDTSSNKTSNGNGSGAYTSNLSDLSANITYYVRAYAINNVGISYGDERQFTTTNISNSAIPSVSTDPITGVTSSSATGGGNVLNDGGQQVTARGICWSSSPNPDITSPTKTNDGSGTGVFVSNISGLTSNITYYVRAYATNIIGTAYGVEQQFTTTIVNSDLLISEISTANFTDSISGGIRARNHYVELFNGTASSIDLTNYAIGYQAVSDSGTLSPWDFSNAANYLTLSGTVTSRGCYVILSAAADPGIPHQITWGTTSTSSANASKPLQLSGNSAIALLKKDLSGAYTLGGNTYSIIDVFGSPLVPRSTATGTSSTRNNFNWIIGGVTDTRNNTFKRKSNVIDPTTDWNLSRGTDLNSSQWLISGYRLWDYTNVGQPTP